MSVEDVAAEILGKLAGSAEIERHLDKFAHEIADEIRDLTPEFGDLDPKRGDPPHGEPGDAKAAITVEPSPRGFLARRVISRDYKALWIELGSRHMPEYAPFAKVAAMHGGTGPDFTEEIHQAQHKLRGEVEKLAKMLATDATAKAIAEQRREVDRARMGRSAAFKAARGYRRRRPGRR